MYVKFATLPVDDVDRAIAFYTGKLRLTLTTDVAMDDGTGGRWIELALPEGNTILLLERGDPQRDRGRPALVLVVPDVDMAFERLDTLGVEFTTQPGETPWQPGSRHAIFRDSEANLVLLTDR